MELKDAIVAKAEEVFLRYGFRSVTMDDLSREMGISKKTLYQVFANKDDLVAAVIDRHEAAEWEMIQSIHASAKDPIEELLRIVQFFQELLRQMSPFVLYDLQKYHREVWQKSLEADRKRKLDMILDNLHRGISTGLYRDDFTPGAIARLHLAHMETCVNIGEDNTQEECAPDFEKWVLEMMILYIRGIASPKGLQLLQQYLNTGVSAATAAH